MKRLLAPSFDFDKAVGLFCVAVASAFGYGTYALEETAAFQQMGPRLWPAVLSIALATTGTVILLKARRGEKKPAGQSVGSTGAAWAVFLAILLSIPVMILLGYLGAGVFLMAAILLLKETREHIVRSILCALLVPAAVYYLFTSVFDQYLPPGLLVP